MSPPIQRSGASPPDERPAPDASGRHHAASMHTQDMPPGPHAVTGISALDYDDLDVLAEVDRITTMAFAVAGCDVPALSDPAWLTAPPAAKIARLLVLAEAYLINHPHQSAAQMMKDASVAISNGRDWSPSLPSHAELVRRRAEPGRTWQPFDPVAVRRWVATGSSEKRAA